MKQKLDQNLKIGRDFDIFEKFVRNRPISEYASNLANFDDIGVWFLGSALPLYTAMFVCSSVQIRKKVKVFEVL
jgi:hypothetical protein